jgi:Protein of unknown function (DUF3300)
MKSRRSRFKFTGQLFYTAVVIGCMALLSPSQSVFAQAQQAQSQAMTTAKEAPKIPNDQLDSLVAPIALYPDPLLSQTLVASTYPLEIIQLQQWMEKNSNLKGKAVADAVAKQDWDPSIQAMAAFPDVVKRLAGDIQWTTDLGNAFLAQQSDVMDAVQHMRAKAQSKGTLKTSAQQKVETQTVEGGKQVIVVEPASPDVVYVPTYDPAVVFGPPVYPYPLIYFPPPGYYAGAAIAFGIGVALGPVWGGSWGWGFGWGGGDVNINVNNYYVNNYNKNVFRHRDFRKLQHRWQHNPQHRRGAPYNRASANQIQRQLATREHGVEPRAETRPGGGGAGERTGEGARPVGGGAGERVGGRHVSAGSGFGSHHSAFGGREFRGDWARASSRRGAYSRRGGGFHGGRRRGGGFHGGRHRR